MRGKDPSTLNLQLLEKYLADIISTDEAYKRWHAAIEEQFVDQIDTTEEDELLSSHLDTYEETESLARCLIDVGTAMTMATSLRTQMSEVETLITSNADKLCDKIINDIKLEFNSLKTLLQRSGISHDHQVQ